MILELLQPKSLGDISDVIGLITCGKLSVAEAAKIVARRDQQTQTYEQQAADEAHALGRAYHKGKAMYAHATA